jgi:hypothetical protein
MVDRKSIKKAFQKAAAQSASDPYALAKLIRSLPSVKSASKQHPNEPRSIPEESLQIEGLDWSSVLTSFINAWEAAEAVSICISVCRC